MAEKYKNKVPDYKLSNGGGQVHAGVIIDKPGYSSYDLNEPPPAFASYAGNVAIDKNLRYKLDKIIALDEQIYKKMGGRKKSSDLVKEYQKAKEKKAHKS